MNVCCLLFKCFVYWWNLYVINLLFCFVIVIVFLKFTFEKRFFSPLSGSQDDKNNFILPSLSPFTFFYHLKKIQV